MAKGVYHIIGNYYITVDPNQYTVAQMKTNKKTGEDSLDYLTYHGELQSAIKSLHRIAVQGALSGSEGDLRDAMRIYSSVTEKLCTALKKALPLISVKTGEEDA